MIVTDQHNTTAINVARDYTRRGWRVLPIPHGTKAPRLKNWSALRLGEDNLPAHFNGAPQNIGVLLGEPSGWLIDVDLDHPDAVALARDYLPATEAVFGRDGKRASHYLYRVTAPIDTTKFQTAARVMLAELRSTGAQTVFPGSTHPTGESITWDGTGDPALIDPDELLAAVKMLAHDVADMIGEPMKDAPAQAPATTPRVTAPAAPDAMDRARRYLDKLPPAISGQGGHDATFHAACELFRFGLGDADAMALLREYNARCVPPWSDAELAHKMDDARAKVAADGEIGVRLNQASPTRTPARPRSDGDELHERAKLCTDIGNAARFALQHGDALRWCGPWQTWLAWTGQRWERDEADAAMRRAIETALSILNEAKDAQSDEQRQRVAKHGADTQRRERLNAMIALAKSDMAVAPNELDADLFAFNTLNGTIDLRTAELRPHDPADLITKIAPVEFDADADAPLWRAFLDRIFAADADLIGFVQRWLGHCLTGDTREQVLPVAYGVGANGKSTLIDAIAAIMGDYAGMTTADLFTESRSGANEQRYELAELCGKRFVVASESERGRRLRVALVKALTGDDLVKCRPIYGRPFAYRRTFKPLLVTNHKPRIDDDTEAVWRRVRLIPFDVVIPKAERDTLLPMKLRAEAPGILAWLVRGCLDWQRYGLGEPDAVTAATAEYRAESDPVAGFIADCCTLNADAWTRSADLRQSYERYAEEQGEKPLAGKWFGEALSRHGLRPERLYAGRGWRGVGLLTEGNA
jgi:putative DNA primase/helicase